MRRRRRRRRLGPTAERSADGGSEARADFAGRENLGRGEVDLIDARRELLGLETAGLVEPDFLAPRRGRRERIEYLARSGCR
jgi:hypothetical protein